jgi:hypothetical protein
MAFLFKTSIIKIHIYLPKLTSRISTETSLDSTAEDLVYELDFYQIKPATPVRVSKSSAAEV